MKYLQPFILLVLLLACAVGVKAQQSEDQKEQLIKSQKIAFFTDKIGLTPEEAEVFWPIYNSYWEKKNTIIADRKNKMTYFTDHNQNMSEEEMTRYANQYINYEMELAKLLDEYHDKFKEILPIEKVMKIYLADYEFKTYLLQMIRESGKDSEK